MEAAIFIVFYFLINNGCRFPKSAQIIGKIILFENRYRMSHSVFFKHLKRAFLWLYAMGISILCVSPSVTQQQFFVLGDFSDLRMKNIWGRMI